MFETVIDYLARTNLLNFIIFASIIAFIYLKLDVNTKLQKGSEEVAEKIEDSKTAKNESEKNLQNIEEKISHLKEDIDEILKQSETNAELVGEQILSDASKTVENIKTNTDKLIENKTGVVKNDIIKRASLASVEVAKEHIVNELNVNKDLHNKFIDESIESINGVEI